MFLRKCEPGLQSQVDARWPHGECARLFGSSSSGSHRDDRGKNIYLCVKLLKNANINLA